MDIELSIKKTNVTKLWKALVFSALAIMLVECGNKSNNDLPDVESYPVAEISEGLAQAAQTYSEVYEFHDSLAIVKGGSYYGVIDRNGNLVIPCEYTSLEQCGKVFYASKGDNYGVITRNGKEIVPFKYDKSKDELTIYTDEGIIRYTEKDKYGNGGTCYFKDLDGHKLFDKGLNYIDDYSVAFHEGLASVAKVNSPELPHGFVDKAGKTVINYRYEEPATFFNGLAMVTEYKGEGNRSVNFIDKHGNEVMKVVKNGYIYGVVDNSGKEVIPCKFKSINCYDSGYLLTTGENNLQGVWSLKDKKEITAPMYKISSEFNKRLGCKTFVEDNRIIIVTKDNKYGAINTEGKEIVPCVYEYAKIENGVIEVVQNMRQFESNRGVYDFDGEEIIKCENFLVNICENSFIVTKSFGSGSSLLDRKGNTIFNAKAESCLRHFSEGLAAIDKDFKGVFGFYAADGDEVIAPRYEDAKTFSEGLAPVKLNGKWGYVNREGVDTFGNK